MSMYLSLQWLSIYFSGIDEDDAGAGDAGMESTEDMPPLEGEEDDASRMEEVD